MNNSSFINNPDDVVIIEALRTPIGKAKRGSFKDTSPDILLRTVLKSVIDRSGINPEDIGEICVGNVLQHGAGASGARIAQLLAGIPYSVPLSSVNRQCSSGLQAVANVAAGIKNEYYDIGIAAGVESMSMSNVKDGMPQVDWEAVRECSDARDCTLPMGITSENVASAYSISREAQDIFSVKSHLKAFKAQKEGRFSTEIVKVKTKIKNSDGKPHQIEVVKDDGIRPETNFESLSKLKPAFSKDGTTTAGNSSQVSDGAAAVLLTSRKKAEELGLEILAVFCGYSVEGVPPSVMGIGPSYAIPSVLKKAGLSISDIDLFEINEAFASQAVYCIQKLELDENKVNPNGGAIALGHPLGCTGARQVATLLNELNRTKGKYGIVSMCVGTGMGAAALFRSDSRANCPRSSL
mmetsp:Transcript_20264/g.29945  ORF Transcript_20264/g.29945 Transcript_20264/m.29945 type:complete len:409 (+) Transcript_20264:166-1392(+)|eukprot:CAMPEP_0171451974 /NCGR_PEP_ID=MMETSP0945-20130129/266_1 /TAXON_ID=109269 /ORGANISM="Vaucheria litorea, Strain CCMP2940" /LENGTH=408 /DNA_ID=CAMNT_0011976545 /DNA_START=142 /DNA_END=1368 /DNA_ORIENTATION=-